MLYTITARTDEQATGVLDQVANDLPDALRKARELLQTSLVKVTIEDCHGNRISGDDLIACCNGKMKLSPDLRAQ